MYNEPIKDSKGNIIGYFREQGKKEIITDYNGNILGFYDPEADVTTDYHNRTIGRGNQLMRLLKD